jgi:hypothetical protein
MIGHGPLSRRAATRVVDSLCLVHPELDVGLDEDLTPEC